MCGGVLASSSKGAGAVAQEKRIQWQFEDRTRQQGRGTRPGSDAHVGEDHGYREHGIRTESSASEHSVELPMPFVDPAQHLPLPFSEHQGIQHAQSIHTTSKSRRCLLTCQNTTNKSMM